MTGAIDISDVDFSFPMGPADSAKLGAWAADMVANMATYFPYSRYHDPRLCWSCDDEGFVATPEWQAAWDAAKADALGDGS